MSYLEKIAEKSKLEDIAMTVGGTTATLVGAEKVIQQTDDLMFKIRLNSIVKYAKRKHPELGEVSDSKLKAWAGAVYTLSPRMADNKELMADAIYQIHQYGGNVDLATAKIIADINRGSKTEKALKYIQTAGSLSR